MVPPNIVGNNEPKQKKEPLNPLLSGTVIVTLATALIYAVNFNYLYGYYDSFGLSAVDMNLSVSQVLSSNAYVFQITVLLFFIWHWIDVRNEKIFDHIMKDKRFVGRMAVGILVITCSTSFLVGKIAAKMRYGDDNKFVAVTTTNGAINNDYRFLCVNDGRL